MRAFSAHVAFAAIALKNEEGTLDTAMTSAKYLASGILFPLSRHRVQPLFPYGLYQAFFFLKPQVRQVAKCQKYQKHMSVPALSLIHI